MGTPTIITQNTTWHTGDVVNLTSEVQIIPLPSTVHLLSKWHYLGFSGAQSIQQGEFVL